MHTRIVTTDCLTAVVASRGFFLVAAAILKYRRNKKMEDVDQTKGQWRVLTMD